MMTSLLRLLLIAFLAVLPDAANADGPASRAMITANTANMRMSHPFLMVAVRTVD